MHVISGRLRLVAALPVAIAVLITSAFFGSTPMLLGVLIAVIAGLGQWIVFPLLGKRSGFVGHALDILVSYGGLVIGGLIAGTLLAAPGWGTILGAQAAVVLPFQSVGTAVIFVVAFALTAHLSRR